MPDPRPFYRRCKSCRRSNYQDFSIYSRGVCALCDNYGKNYSWKHSPWEEVQPPREELATQSPIQSKPVDPQWSCQSGGGFIWTWKKALREVLTSKGMNHNDGILTSKGMDHKDGSTSKGMDHNDGILTSKGMDHKDGSTEDHHKMFPTTSPVPLFQVESHLNKKLCVRPGESALENRFPSSTSGWRMVPPQRVELVTSMVPIMNQCSEGYLDNKCKIFLSHAGTEKGFVTELNKELQSVYHFGVFFDKDEASLPKGEEFPQRIIQAAKHCELAIVVISHEYFIRKWPKLELKTFIEEQKIRPELKILPVFYKLSVDEFKQAKRQRSYEESWNRDLSSCNISNCRWRDALRVISSTNGINLQSSEVAMMAEIVKTTFKLVRPHLLSDDSHVQGKIRISEEIQKSFQGSHKKSNAEDATSVCIVGLYGMGGSGKTTMSRVLCNDMIQDFFGKVCHIEFGAHKVLDLYKQLIRCVTRLEDIFWRTEVSSAETALSLLNDFISNQRIFLVLDNVDEASFTEAQTLLELPFKEGSVIMVTTRSILILQELKRTLKCKLKNVSWRPWIKVPALTKDEAVNLLSHCAKCDTLTLSAAEKEMWANFAEECCFDVECSREYHPLALRVLGARVGPDPREWREIKVDFKHHNTYETENRIFSILRSGYDALDPQKRRMFADLVLGRSGLAYPINSLDFTWRLRYLYNERSYGFTFELLEIFKSKSLIEYYNPYSGDILVHDLYREFVQAEVGMGKFQHSLDCCVSGAPNQRYKQPHRLRIYKQEIQHLNKAMLCACANSELVTIEDCSQLKSIDVRAMQNLKVLEIVGCPQLKTVSLKNLKNLRSIIWKGFKGKYPSLEGAKSLRGVFIISDENETKDSIQVSRDPTAEICPIKIQQSSDTIDLSKCPYLDVLEFWNQPTMPKLPDFNSLLKLTILHVNNLQGFQSFLSLQVLVDLISLQLYDCSSLLEFPSLTSFPLLEILTLEGAEVLQSLTGFKRLIALKFLSLKNARSLQRLPGIRACRNLKGVDLSNTHQLQNFFWISSMLYLEKVNLSSSGLRLVPDCSQLYKLEELYFNDCPNLEGFKEKTAGMGESLRRISMWNCLKLTALPQLSGSALTHLKITRTSVQDVSGVEHCVHLQYLDCAYSSVRSFPDLSNLKSLKRLNVRGCLYLTRLDNIKSLPALEELFVQDCPNLVALPDLTSSTFLMELDLHNCPLVDPNLVKLPGSGSLHLPPAKNESTDIDMEDTNDVIVEEPILPTRATRWWRMIVNFEMFPNRWSSN